MKKTNLFEAYIDSFNEITILIDKDLYKENKSFYIDIDGEKKEFDIIGLFEDYSFYKYIVRFIPQISLNKDYYIYDEKHRKTILKSGSIIRTYEFENRFRYKGPLGVEYHYEESIFRVWSPVAKEIEVEITTDDNVKRYPLSIKDNGLWEVSIKGDLEYAKYVYYVRVFTDFDRVTDPYGISLTADKKYNYIVDIANFYKMKYKKPEFSGNYTDAIIYEASVRDFTCLRLDDLRGTYLGMIDEKVDTNGEARGLDYIKSLGITHLQLMPTYEFGGVDPIKKNESYNWGYNPEAYMVPSGWLSKNPNDPYSRINELLELIDECHKRGMRVVMDVVFNHVYHVDEFPFESLVPGYYFRMEEDGSYSNASGCGNVLASERFMASRYITDTLAYYAEIFNVSGFRFDLMGLLDIGTMNSAREILKKIDSCIMLYGEGWNMANPLPEELRPHMYNYKKIPGYAFFNDKYRDYIKGSNWGKKPGYAFGHEKEFYDITNLLMGSCLNYYKFDEPYQTINYVECHDNYTFFDYGKYHLGFRPKAVKRAAVLALQLVILSEGVPFIHAGEEFIRTKCGVENSYNAKDSINKIDYARRNKNVDVINMLRDLISIRKEYEVFRFNSAEKIKKNVRPVNCGKHKNIMILQYDGNGYKLLVVVKNDAKPTTLISNGYDMIFNNRGKCLLTGEKYPVVDSGIYIFKKEVK